MDDALNIQFADGDIIGAFAVRGGSDSIAKNIKPIRRNGIWDYQTFKIKYITL